MVRAWPSIASNIITTHIAIALSEPMMKLSCLIVDDEPLSRAGIRQLLEQQPQFTVTAEADNGEDALKLALLHQPGYYYSRCGATRFGWFDGTQTA